MSAAFSSHHRGNSDAGEVGIDFLDFSLHQARDGSWSLELELESGR